MPEPQSAAVLEINDNLWQEILAHLQECLPNEGVGLLSTVNDSAILRAVRYYPGRNLNESPSRFTMDPLDVLRACEEMESEGTRLGVVVHSHPLTAPEPSQTDLRELALPGVVSLIVQLHPHIWARSWEISPAGVVELPIRCDDPMSGEGTRA